MPVGGRSVRLPTLPRLIEKVSICATCSSRVTECLLPGVPSTATVVFTVLHQAPTRAVCLGQACVSPLSCKSEGGHLGTASLTPRKVSEKKSKTPLCIVQRRAPLARAGARLTPGRRAETHERYPSPEAILCPQIPIYSQRSAKRPSEEFRMDDAQRNKHGQLTFFIR